MGVTVPSLKVVGRVKWDSVSLHIYVYIYIERERARAT